MVCKKLRYHERFFFRSKEYQETYEIEIKTLMLFSQTMHEY